MRREAGHAGLRLSVRELLSQLSAIGETVLIYPTTRGRPKARRMTTELTTHQQKLHEPSTWAGGHPRVRRYVSSGWGLAHM